MRSKRYKVVFEVGTKTMSLAAQEEVLDILARIIAREYLRQHSTPATPISKDAPSVPGHPSQPTVIKKTITP